MKGETCQILLVHLIPLPDSITELIMLPREEEKLEKINTPFQKALDRLQKSYAVEIAELEVVHLYGDSSPKLKNFIDQYAIDLILCPVVESKATKPNSIELFSNLVKDISCPVLYIPNNAEANRFRKIAYVLDTDDKYTLLLHDLLLNLTSRQGNYVTFLVVFKPSTNIDKLQSVLQKVYRNEKLKNINCSVHLIQENDLRDGVCSYVEEFDVDLLVTGLKRNLLDTLFTRQRISSDVTKHTKVPLLTIV